jgi:hypothetical protein
MDNIARLREVREVNIALREMLDDSRSEMAMIQEALGVSYEPHQNLFERTLEAAQAAGKILKGD